MTYLDSKLPSNVMTWLQCSNAFKKNGFVAPMIVAAGIYNGINASIIYTLLSRAE